MSVAEYVALVVLLAGFAFGVALVVWGLLDDDSGDEDGWGGPDEDPAPDPLPGSPGRELLGAGH